MRALAGAREALLCLACAAALVAGDWLYLYYRYGYHRREATE